MTLVTVKTLKDKSEVSKWLQRDFRWSQRHFQVFQWINEFLDLEDDITPLALNATFWVNNLILENLKIIQNPEYSDFSSKVVGVLTFKPKV